MYHIAILDDERKEAEHIKELADVYFDRKELMQRSGALISSITEMSCLRM